MKKLMTLFLLFSTIISFTQEITGDELLEKAIQYHDPNGNWETFKGVLFVSMQTPKKTNRESEINIDIPNQYFSVKASSGENTLIYIVDRDSIGIIFNGDENPSEEILKKNKLSMSRAKRYKNYYTYLYGLPMKLKDKGTIIHQKVEYKIFKGKEYLLLKVTYNKDVGKDTWNFYFDPKTYAMEVYQFFKETKNSGEYILLSGTETINKIKMPKVRAWYYNKGNNYLGTDILYSKK